MSGFEPTQVPPAHEGQLSSEHLAALLQGSGLSRDVIRARGYRTTSTRAEMKRMGFSDAQARVPALIIPVYDTSGESVLYQARPDTPRIKGGKPIKYETPQGTRMVLDVHPAGPGCPGQPGYSPVRDRRHQKGRLPRLPQRLLRRRPVFQHCLCLLGGHWRRG